MIRVEIIANQSMEEKILNNQEAAIPGFLYTVIPLAHGRGKKTRKLGTTTWPETNVIIIAYLDSRREKIAGTVVDYIKGNFHDEGIKMFMLHEKG